MLQATQERIARRCEKKFAPHRLKIGNCLMLTPRFPVETGRLTTITCRRACRNANSYSAVRHGRASRWRTDFGMPCKIFAMLRIYLVKRSSTGLGTNVPAPQSIQRLGSRSLHASEFALGTFRSFEGHAIVASTRRVRIIRHIPIARDRRSVSRRRSGSADVLRGLSWARPGRKP
jgi:hypothetical protein